jgi:histidyl-tRNA synthetase
MSSPQPSNSPPAPSQHSFQAPTGTRDFYPAELARLRYIQDTWRRTSINHGFEEIDGPTFEHLDLYTVKSGEGIVSELFSFERFGGEKKFALRPEFTPTLARLYAAKANALPKPTKWFWQQNCFRAERPQRGRLREFCQWNCDIIGDDSPAADAEVIACAVQMLQSVGLSPLDTVVRINDRRFAEKQFLDLGVPPDLIGDAISLVDRREKLSVQEFRREAQQLRVPEPAIESLLSGEGIFLVTPADAVASSQIMASASRDTLAGARFALAHQLQALGVSAWCKFDTKVVRGLAYYTGMVFEVHEATGAERAIAGGGRYDKLIEMFGGPTTPAVGFGMGDVVLSLVLQDKGLFPTDDTIADKLGLRPDVFVISNGQPEADAEVAPMLAKLRREGLHARRTYKATKNVGKLLGDAVKARARFALIIESATGGQLKNLTTQAQEAVGLEQVVERVRR